MRSNDHLEVIVAQAAYTAAEFDLFDARGVGVPDERDQAAIEAFIRSNATWSKEAYVTSLDTLRRIQPERAFFSHDPVVWRGLELEGVT